MGSSPLRHYAQRNPPLPRCGIGSARPNSHVSRHKYHLNWRRWYQGLPERWEHRWCTRSSGDSRDHVYWGGVAVRSELCVCSKGNSFRTAAAYQRHMRQRYSDPEFVFSCTICQKNYGNAAGVSGHYPSCKSRAEVMARTTVGTMAGAPAVASDSGRRTPEIPHNSGGEVRTYAEVEALSPLCAQSLPSSSPISGHVIAIRVLDQVPQVKCNV